MTPAEFFTILVGVVFGSLSTVWFTRKYGLTRPNFQGRSIPAIGGLFFLVYGEFVYAAEWIAQGLGVGSAAAYFLVVFGFGILGLADDIFGDRSIGGFRGHFRALAQGRLTTGAAKALGGGVVCLVAGYLLNAPNLGHMLLAATLIALSANTSNLLDLRPGRCLFAFFVGSVIILGVLFAHHTLAAGFLFYLAIAAAALLYPWDAFGRIMLGDTGSNAFGAVLGVAAALYFTTFWQLLCVLCLVFFQVWCESHSLSALIEKTPILRSLDRKIGVR